MRRDHIRDIFANLRNQITPNFKRGFCSVVGLAKTSLTLTFGAVAATIRIVCQWATRNDLTTDPLGESTPQN